MYRMVHPYADGPSKANGDQGRRGHGDRRRNETQGDADPPHLLILAVYRPRLLPLVQRAAYPSRLAEAQFPGSLFEFYHSRQDVHFPPRTLLLDTAELIPAQTSFDPQPCPYLFAHLEHAVIATARDIRLAAGIFADTRFRQGPLPRSFRHP